MRSAGILSVVVFVFFSLGFPSCAASAEPLAVIVHPTNVLEDVSFEDLVKIFRTEKQYWPHDGRIYLLLHEAASPEQKQILDHIYGMDAAALKKMWLEKMYQGQISSFPKTCSSNESVRAFVKAVPNAVGIIRSEYVDAGVKVLKIDGRLPGDSGYRFFN